MTVPARLSFQSTLTILLTIFRTAERTWLQERKARRGKPEESRDRRKAGTDGGGKPGQTVLFLISCFPETL
jgi:hypothetical protein